MWLCRRGSPRAGFSACFGGPLFNLLLGIGLPFTIQLLHEGKASIPLGRKLISRAANDPSVFTITEKAPTRAFSWLKALVLSHLRHYAKQAPEDGKEI